MHLRGPAVVGEGGRPTEAHSPVQPAVRQVDYFTRLLHAFKRLLLRCQHCVVLSKQPLNVGLHRGEAWGRERAVGRMVD